MAARPEMSDSRGQLHLSPVLLSRLSMTKLRNALSMMVCIAEGGLICFEAAVIKVDVSSSHVNPIPRCISGCCGCQTLRDESLAYNLLRDRDCCGGLRYALLQSPGRVIDGGTSALLGEVAVGAHARYGLNVPSAGRTCLRVFAYSTVTSSTRCIPPTLSAAMAIVPISTARPSFSGCGRRSAGAFVQCHGARFASEVELVHGLDFRVRPRDPIPWILPRKSRCAPRIGHKHFP